MVATRLSLLAVLFVVLLGCGGDYDSATRLRNAVHTLNADLRWQRWETAESLCTAAARRQLAERRRRFGDDLQVADFDVMRTVLNKAKNEARVTVVLSWYRMSSSVLYRTVVEQIWEVHGQSWLLASEQRRAGDVL